jgi:penicillin-binding protein 2
LTLKAIVEESVGTGFKTARLPSISIAGETCTAWTVPPESRTLPGSLAAFSAHKPPYVIVVVLEHGGSGSKAAGPVAREVIRSMAERGLLDDGKVSGRTE